MKTKAKGAGEKMRDNLKRARLATIEAKYATEQGATEEERAEAEAICRSLDSDPPGPRHGDLKVWWIPQVPGKPFEVPVADIVEAALLIDTLADYDKFQLENRIKPDCSNAGGLMVFDAKDGTDSPAGSWVDWYGDEDGRNLDDYLKSIGVHGLRERKRQGQLPEWEHA